MCRRTFWKGDGQKISSVVFRKYSRQGLRIQDIRMHGIAGGDCLCIVDKAAIRFRSQRAMDPKLLEPFPVADAELGKSTGNVRGVSGVTASTQKFGPTRIELPD